MFTRKGSQPLVLHVDDEPDILGTVKVALEAIGLEVASATSAAEGLRLVEKRRPDVVLLDIAMPFTDGFETCRALKQRCPGVPVIMVTALSQFKDVEKALASGADGYMTKPFSIEKLHAKVLEALKGAGPERA